MLTEECWAELRRLHSEMVQARIEAASHHPWRSRDGRPQDPDAPRRAEAAAEDAFAAALRDAGPDIMDEIDRFRVGDAVRQSQVEEALRGELTSTGEVVGSLQVRVADLTAALRRVVVAYLPPDALAEPLPETELADAMIAASALLVEPPESGPCPECAKHPGDHLRCPHRALLAVFKSD
jgi:hypothetical protein